MTLSILYFQNSLQFGLVSDEYFIGRSIYIEITLGIGLVVILRLRQVPSRISHRSRIICVVLIILSWLKILLF